MTTSMYCLYVGVDYAYIDVNALAQGIKSFLASQVWFQAVAEAPIRPQLLVNHSATETSIYMYVCIDVCMHACMYCMYVCVCMHAWMYMCVRACMYVCMYIYIYIYIYIYVYVCVCGGGGVK